MYKRLTRFRIRLKLMPPPPLFGVRNYLINYFAMCKRLTLSRIRVDLASPAYLGLGII